MTVNILLFLPLSSIVLRDKNIIGFLLFVIIMLFCPILLIIDSITEIYDSLSTITIDENGVKSENKYHKEALTWEEVKDYGIFNKNGELLTGKYIYFSGRKFSYKDKNNLNNFAKILKIPNYPFWTSGHSIWLPAYIKKKQAQSKEDIIIYFRYTDERWKYICSLDFFKEKQAECGELERKQKYT